jgi:hypothetical protein
MTLGDHEGPSVIPLQEGQQGGHERSGRSEFELFIVG